MAVMVVKSLKFVDAVIRVNALVDFYAKEKTRLEDNVAKLLLPSGLTFVAASLKDVLDPKYEGAAIFLGFFFLIYALLIYLDLFAAERVYVTAFKLQDSLYKHADADGAKPLAEVADAPTLEAYDRVEAQVGKQRYSMPTSKPLFAMLGGAAAFLIYRWVK
jgi:hypothetical protein